MAVTTQLGDKFFQRAFQVTQLATVEGIVSLAFEQEPGGRDFVAGASHLAPRLAVLFMPEMTGAAGRDVHLASGRGDANGNHVAQIFGNDISDDEVDFFGGVCRGSLEFHDVTGSVGAAAGLDLNAPELLAGVEDEIVAFAISPGFGYAEAETGGFGKEGGLGGFAKRLACSEADCVDFRNVLGHGAFQVWGNKKGATRGAAPLVLLFSG